MPILDAQMAVPRTDIPVATARTAALNLWRW
jgi:hypothetical protein